MKHSTKMAEVVQIKTLGPVDGEPEGTFEAVFAVFDNVDKVGDRVKSKAFDRTLGEWREKNDERGARVPIIFAHDWGNPMSYIGSADPHEVYPIPGRGVYAKGIVEHMDTNPVARQVYNLMKSGVITEFSYGYNVPPGGEKKAKDGATDLEDLTLFEFGPCLKGINPETELLGVKGDLGPLHKAVVAEEKVKSYVDVEVTGSFEEIQEALADALREKYPPPSSADGSIMSGWRTVQIVATTGSEVTYQICSSGDDDDQMWRSSYTMSDDGESATLGDPVEVTATIVPKSDEETEVKTEEQPDEKAAAAGSRTELVQEAFTLAHDKYPDGLPQAVTSAILKDPQKYVDDNKPKKALEMEALQMLAKSWDVDSSQYTDSQYAKACILDRALGDDSFKDVSAKERYGLPIAKPGGTYTTNPDEAGCAAAATRIAGVKSSGEAASTAAKRLQRAYTKLGTESPDKVKELAQAEVMEFVDAVWQGSDSIETIQAKNLEMGSVLARELWEQTIDNVEATVGPMSADAIEAQHMNDRLTDELLRQID